MKPVGLRHPKTGREPYAAVQLRQENLMADAYSLVGFQNHLRYGEQARVLRLIPGLQNAEFLQFGQIHRNTYICSPRVLEPTMQMRERPNLFFAGQITGVEGYVESVAMGWLAGVNAARLAFGLELLEAPARSATGSLAHYVSHAEAKNFQPVNITFALLPPLPEPAKRNVRKKRERRQLQVDLALKEWAEWLEQNHTNYGNRSRRLKSPIVASSDRAHSACASPCLRGGNRAGSGNLKTRRAIGTDRRSESSRKFSPTFTTTKKGRRRHRSRRHRQDLFKPGSDSRFGS